MSTRPQFGPKVEFPCPFCGAPAGAGDGAVPQVTHAYPPCAEFVELDAMSFVQAARQKLVGPMPWDTAD